MVLRDLVTYGEWLFIDPGANRQLTVMLTKEHLLAKTQYHDVAGTRGIFIVVWMPNDAFHSKHLLEGMIILNIRQYNDYLLDS